MTTTNNIISFPKQSKVTVSSEDDMKKRTEEAKMEYVDEIVDMIMVKVLNTLHHHGFDISSDEFANNYAYFVEVFRYVLWKSSNIQEEHPFNYHIREIVDALDGIYPEIS